MKSNMLPIESGIRALIGLPLLASPILNLPTYPYNLFGIVLVLTGVSTFCPLKALAKKLVPARLSSTTRPAQAHG